MSFKVDRGILKSGSFQDSVKESRDYLRSITPEERLQILEFLREQMYVETRPRLQRVLEVVYNTRS